MIRFNKEGLMVYPCPCKGDEDETILVAEECFCPNGHNLINDKLNSTALKVFS